MVTSIVSSLGGGSGLDTAKLVEDLASASRAPKVEMLGKRLQAAQARISAVAQARSDLESFASSLTNLVAGGSLQSQPAISDPTILVATAAPGVRIGALSSEIVVDRLARAQTLYSDYVAAASDPIGQGSMTLSVGGHDFAIAVGASNDSLSGLASAINSVASGVTASIVTDSNGARLVLRGETGLAGAFTLTTADPALQPFAYGSGSGLTVGQAAQDSSFTVDGVAYERSSNSISDVISGVTLTLRKAAPGEPTTLSSERPTEALRQTLQDFVGVFNTLRKDIAAARSATGGDSALRSLDRQLSSLLTAQLGSDPAIGRLSDVGIKTNRDGTISLDPAKLEAALRDHPDAVEALFSPASGASPVTDPGIGKALQQLADKATGTDGILETLRSRLAKESAGIVKDQERMEARETAYRTRLERQFGTLDSRISALKATQSYLEQQIKVWTNSEN
ncbi:MAG TPA: flagellar filament capping protein FliD [Sphingomicrobium sp.]|nr:flagellar filament capping protein FliD [Sphingomicrobium sp.]